VCVYPRCIRSCTQRFLATVGDTVDKRLYIWDLKRLVGVDAEYITS